MSTENQVSGKLFLELSRIAKKFNEKGINYILVGGLALYLVGIRRYTEDIDFVFLAEPEELRKIKEALFELYGDPSIMDLTEEDLSYSVIRYGAPEVTIDLIFRIGEIASYETLKKFRRTIFLGDVPICTLTEEGLIFLKEGSLRPPDQQDVLWLKRLLQEKIKKKDKDLVS